VGKTKAFPYSGLTLNPLPDERSEHTGGERWRLARLEKLCISIIVLYSLYLLLLLACACGCCKFKYVEEEKKKRV